jgi:hypothetical protein
MNVGRNSCPTLLGLMLLLTLVCEKKQIRGYINGNIDRNFKFNFKFKFNTNFNINCVGQECPTHR